MRVIYLFVIVSLFTVNNIYSQFKEIAERPKSEVSTPELNEDLILKSAIGENERINSYSFKTIPFDVSNGLDIEQIRLDGDRPIFIKAKLKERIPGRTKTVEAGIFLSALSNKLKIQDPEQEWIMGDIVDDELGMSHMKIKQQFNGIPVYGSEMVIHWKGSEISSINGRSYPSPVKLKTDHHLQASEARFYVEASFRWGPRYRNLSDEEMKYIDGEQWDEELVIYHPEEKKDSPVLAWHVRVYTNVVDRWDYFVDANSGRIITRYKTICKFHNHHSENVCLDGPATANAQDLLGQTRTISTYDIGGTFYMIDASRTMFNAGQSILPDQPVGTIWTLDAGNTSPENANFSVSHNAALGNNWTGQATAVSAHYNAGEAYEYFKSTFGRESINGNGGNIISVINVTEADGSDMDNAFYNGAAMFYGNGNIAFDQLAKALDVSAHEISHGVVQTTANLEYFGESGAINESFADIFGSMVDRDDWKMGEDVVNTDVFPSGALRDMENPHNGAATNDFSSGWQPQKYSERFTGSQDNMGVHINSGIPNHAFFLFATAVGKEKAEQVFYRALTRYLVKSSQFIDLRIAVEQSAADLYGMTEVDAVKAAFDAVEIGEGEGGNYEEEVIENPGQDFIIFSDEQRSQLILIDGGGTIVANPLSATAPISKPSVTDDGSRIVFVGADAHMYQISIDWQNSTFNQDRLSTNPEWSNVAISKDGSKIAGVLNDDMPVIWVFNLDANPITSNSFILENPTSADGIATGDVLFADAMEFDFNNEWIMYDAANRIQGDFGEDIEYWDIGFLNVWDNNTDDYASGRISKLFSGLPENVSIGNPTFSSNAPFIIAFDVIELVDEINNLFNYSIFGANIETQEVAQIFSNTTLGFPSYSRDDSQILYNFETIHLDVGISDLEDNRIEGVVNSESIKIPQAGWAVWFSNGIREFNTPVIELNNQIEGVNVYPNPTQEEIKIEIAWENNELGKIEVFNLLGSKMKSESVALSPGIQSLNMSLADLPEGNYILRISIGDKVNSRMIGKY